MSNFVSPPAKPGVYPGLIKIWQRGCSPPLETPFNCARLKRRGLLRINAVSRPGQNQLRRDEFNFTNPLWSTTRRPPCQREKLKVSLCKGRFRGISDPARRDFDKTLGLRDRPELQMSVCQTYSTSDAVRFWARAFVGRVSQRNPTTSIAIDATSLRLPSRWQMLFYGGDAGALSAALR